jgi:TM2 domain-containing membrane protein YozV
MKKILLLPFLFLALVSCSKQEIVVKNQSSTSVVVASAPKAASLNETQTPVALASNSQEALIQSLAATPNVQKLVANELATGEQVKMNRIQKMRTMIKAKKEIKKALKVEKESATTGSGKSQLIALLLAFFLGGLGIHRFYLGYTWQGVVQLLTGGGCGIWALIDFVRIIIGDLGPKDGSYSDKL